MKTAPLILTAAVGLVLTACTENIAPPQMEVDDRLTWSSVPTIKVRGLEPGQPYLLQTERTSFWVPTGIEQSRLTYVADENGRIDTSLFSPVELEETSPYLPIREMEFIDDVNLEGVEKDEIRFTLRHPKGGTIIERIVGLGPDLSDLTEDPLGEGFVGAYVMRRSDAGKAAPGIVLLGGSEGGDRGSRYTAPILASEGYTVLGLPYYSPAWFGNDPQFPDLPRAFAELPVDYLESAVAEFRQRDDVDEDRIILFGGSKGAEFVLLAGSLIPDDSVGGGFCGIVADVPTDVVWEGWGPGTTPGQTSSFSWRGEALPFVPYTDMGRVFRDDNYQMVEAHENGRKDNPERIDAARIRVEDIDEPVLVIGGDRDTTWASGQMSRTIKKTRDAAGLETLAYTYPEAGHGVGGTPMVRTQAANLEARLENFPATLQFIRRVSSRNNCRT